MPPIDLHCNHLGNKVGTELTETLKATPANASCSQLGNKTNTELSKALRVIPTTVTSLNLRCNYLYNQTGTELAQAFTSIPPTVTSLNLCNNSLGHKGGAELAKAFAAIPEHITTVHLGNNHLFANRNKIVKDGILKALGENRQRFILVGNGESDLARALAPMVEIRSKYHLPYDAALKILFFLDKNDKNPRIENQLEDAEAAMLAIRSTKF